MFQLLNNILYFHNRFYIYSKIGKIRIKIYTMFGDRDYLPNILGRITKHLILKRLN